MRKEAQNAVTINLRSAVWNWIDVFPGEFNEAIRVRGRTDGAPERVFDLLYSMVPIAGERIFWPTLTVLHCITFDRIAPDYQFGSSTPKSRKVGIDSQWISVFCDDSDCFFWAYF